MTRLNDEDLDKLERALAEAHRSRQQPSLGVGWDRHVLRDIRQGAAEHRYPMMSTWIDRLVWRAAAAAAVLALVFAGSVAVYSSKDTVELASLLSDEFDAGTPLIE
ncbi:MAG TPA: hypothetical protein VJM82_02155 [Nitrospiraceae bacterium]|nr:hypothetical protein [Nitrospiraceae bacterium]